MQRWLAMAVCACAVGACGGKTGGAATGSPAEPPPPAPAPEPASSDEPVTAADDALSECMGDDSDSGLDGWRCVCVIVCTSADPGDADSELTLPVAVEEAAADADPTFELRWDDTGVASECGVSGTDLGVSTCDDLVSLPF